VAKPAQKTHVKKSAPKVRNHKTKSVNSLSSLGPNMTVSVLLTTIGKILYFVGKPFYFLLSHIVIALSFVLYITGHYTKLLVQGLFLFLAKIPATILRELSNIPKRPQAKKAKIARVVYKAKKDLFPKWITEKLPSVKIALLNLRLRSFRLRIPSLKLRLPHRKPGTSQFFLISAIFLLVVVPGTLVFYIFNGIPSPSKLTERSIDVSTKIYDRNGVLLYNIYKDKNRTLIPLEKIPLQVRLATLAAEDAEFYSHPGFSIRGIVRSIIRNISKGEVTGGSTITQQLVKNALLTPEKTVIRKVREIILALLVETKYTKDQILEMYLNEVAYGGTSYGIEEASQTYFGKSVNKLTLGEAALLAGLPKSPTTYSPFGANPDLAVERQKEVLHLMEVNGFISQDQEDAALAEALTFSQNTTDIKAPHFVMYVRQALEEAYGKEVVEKGGLEVTTTLDWEIQKLTEEVVTKEIDKLKGLNVTNGAAVILDPKTGEILAMVGSKDYFDIVHDGNVNVTTALRQPGSSIKVVNYSYALTQNYTPATIISDAPVSFKIQGQEAYIPKNYDGKFRGDITLRSALAESRNIPAVKVLASYGVNKMIDLGTKMGITTWGDRSRFGLSLTLGGGEVKLLELAQVYATVANSGTRPEIKSLISIKDYKGKELFSISQDCQSLSKSALEVEAAQNYTKNCGEEKVLDPRVAFLITDILKDNVARSPAFGSASYLVIAKHPEVAVKTGTSNNLRDNLTIGYNQKYLTAVWVGNNDNSPMSKIASGVTGASPIWNKIMSGLLVDEESVAWEAPSGVVKLTICAMTGTLPCTGCPTKSEWFLDENKPQYACNPEVVQKITEGKPQGEVLTPAASTENFVVRTQSIN